ncbi:MAG: phospholipase D-like domain-containing protein [Cyanobacteria bacterium J06626_23]
MVKPSSSPRVRVHTYRTKPRLWRWSLLFLFGLLFAVALAVWRCQPTLTPAAEALPQDDHIQVFFNQSPAGVYSDPYRQVQRWGDDLEQVLITAIEQANTTIDVAVQEINLPNIARALQQQSRSGVRVRVIVENQYRQPWSTRDTSWLAQQDDYARGKYENLRAFGDQNGDGQVSSAEAADRDAMLILQTARVPLIDDTADGTKGSGLMHHKFMVIDGQQVITGSANWTLSGLHGDALLPESRGNTNALLVIDSPQLAERYRQEFDLMWGDGPEGQRDSAFGVQKPLRGPQSVTLPGSTITVQFAPNTADTPREQTVNGLIGQTLQQANRSIDLALFVFTDQGIADSLQARAAAGVQIRSLIDRSFVYRSYSEALDMMGMALPDHRCRYEKNNRPWSTPIASVGFPELPEGDKLHHKFALIDNRTVVIGSHNWSKAANTKNDENLLVIDNPTVAKHFQREFERLYQNANLAQTPYLQNQIAKFQQQCGR